MYVVKILLANVVSETRTPIVQSGLLARGCGCASRIWLAHRACCFHTLHSGVRFTKSLKQAPIARYYNIIFKK